eukprot:494649-Prorocentrum_minimum.AAC.2
MSWLDRWSVIRLSVCALQGDPPETFKRFWRFLLKKSLPADSLSGVACAVFGLGDSGYVQYNVSLLVRRVVRPACVHHRTAQWPTSSRTGTAKIANRRVRFPMHE